MQYKVVDTMKVCLLTRYTQTLQYFARKRNYGDRKNTIIIIIVYILYTQ